MLYFLTSTANNFKKETFDVTSFDRRLFAVALDRKKTLALTLESYHSINQFFA